MEGVWDDEYESDNISNLSEAEEVPEKGSRTLKIIGPDDPDQPKEPKKMRIVRNPRPKLDTDRLLTEDRGLPELLNMGREVMFEPGKEVEGVKQTMAMIQLWSHRLFPKYTFRDFLSKTETLGKKRPIKTHLRKVRTGMIPH